MKNKRYIPFIASLTIAVLLFTGCATGPNPAFLQSIAQQAAFESGSLLKDKYPNELNLTYTSLNAFVAVGGGTVNDLAQALSPLPIKALQGTNGAVLAQGSALLIHSGGQLLLNLNTNVANVNNQYVLPVATGLRDGLGQALGK
jgi:hypothetical protein